LAEEGLSVTIDRVSYEETGRREEIPYKTIERSSYELNKGEKKVIQKGEKGIREIIQSKKIVNGECVEKVDLKTSVIKRPKSEVVAIGKALVRSQKVAQCVKNSDVAPGVDATEQIKPEWGTHTTKSGKSFSYSKVIKGTATAYTSKPGKCTATGTLPDRGQVAVNFSQIPKGTKVYVECKGAPQYSGFYTATDTGGALNDGRAAVDIWMPERDECLKFGRKNTNIYVIGE
jgi:3D (Asp-Asp-Asp) domain-containing protein